MAVTDANICHRWINFILSKLFILGKWMIWSTYQREKTTGSSLILHSSPSIEQLKIEDCPNLKGWWQRQRDSVEELHNHSLPSFPHLSYLRIWKCPKLISLPLFPYLEKLVLSKCSLKPLEQTLRMEVIKTATPKNLTSIAVTSTSYSSTLATSSLQTLKIWYCTSLLAIPEWICNHTSLRTLQILECPILSKRCEREAGEDWSEIAHIPHLDIR